jgi:hypothetical protein
MIAMIVLMVVVVIAMSVLVHLSTQLMSKSF